MTFFHRSRGAASSLLRLLSYIICISLILSALVLAAPGQTARAQAGEPDLRWSVEALVPAPTGAERSALSADSARLELESTLAAGLTGPGVRVRVEPDGLGFRVNLSGIGEDLLRRVLFTDLREQIRLYEGGAEVLINAHAARGQQLALTLDSNITTGFGWEWSDINPAQFRLVGEPETQPAPGSFRLGAPQRVTAVLEAAADGDLSARLVYQRPWRTADLPKVRLEIQAEALPPALNLSDPALDSAAQLSLEQPGPQPLTSIEPQALPASFDWRTQGKVSSVKDQGGCGSCWAFGVVGVLESAIKVQLNAAEKDLSEQFLVSCNSYGYDCDGGWWDAHDFHYNRVKAPQVEPGSVTETQLPYTQSNGSCTVNYTKGYRLARWQYINYETPDVTAIKQAILSYGPVGTAVCVGNAFSNYSGGVFDTNENCGTAVVNHAVVLVGWDDSTQSWIMKNSWDTWWGENGYMRIKYGTSHIGFWANYVLVQSTSPAQVLPAAGAVIDGLRPTFTWEAVTDALDYQIQVSTTSGFTTAEVDAAPAGLSYALTQDLSPNTLYYWRVRARLSSGYTAWTAGRAFKTLPSVPAPASPVGGETAPGLRPALTWTETGTAVKYEVQIAALEDFSQLRASGSSTALTWTPAVDLPRGTRLYWRVRAVGAYGTSAWSAAAAFATPDPPQPPVLTAPVSGAVFAAASKPTFAWKAPVVSLPAGYHIQFAYISNFSNIASEADVTGTTYTFPDTLLANGPLYWRVASYNGEPRMTSAYTAARMIKILPAVPGVISPLGAPVTRLRPTLTWETGRNKLVYDLQVSRLSSCGSPFRTAALSVSSYTFPTDLARLTTYYWRVRARGLYGASAWSTCQSFTTPNPPSVPVVLAPASGSTLPTAAQFRPTFVWKVSTNQPDGYIIQVSQGSKFNPATAVEQVVNDPNQTRLTWPEPLSYGVYSWRMLAFRNGPEYSSWTGVRTFKTPGGLTGVVKDAATGAGLAGVKVTVSGTSLVTYTDSSGAYSLPVVPAGTRTVAYSLSGYTSTSRSVTFSAGVLRTVNLSMTKRVTSAR